MQRAHEQHKHRGYGGFDRWGAGSKVHILLPPFGSSKVSLGSSDNEVESLT